MINQQDILIFVIGLCECLFGNCLQIAAMSEGKWIKLLNTEEKMFLDTQDPNRQQFTIDELRKVLIERNRLKSQIIEVEEELLVYRQAG